MPLKPRLADVQCTRFQFQPGDRVLVRSRHRLSREDKIKLRNTVQRWAGSDVEVLVYCPLDLEIEIERR